MMAFNFYTLVISFLKNTRKFLRITPTTVLFLANCHAPASRPVEIVAEDMCGYCRMAISERQYAAECVDKQGTAWKFDDIGCMTNYLGSRNGQNDELVCYVVDFDSRQWISASQAFFVRSIKYKTPMGGSVAAFGDKPRAERAASKLRGNVTSFVELRSQALPERPRT